MLFCNLEFMDVLYGEGSLVSENYHMDIIQELTCPKTGFGEN